MPTPAAEAPPVAPAAPQTPPTDQPPAAPAVESGPGNPPVTMPRPPQFQGRFSAPGLRTSGGRLSFSAGRGRHQFRPSGWRPPQTGQPASAGDNPPAAPESAAPQTPAADQPQTINPQEGPAESQANQPGRPLPPPPPRQPQPQQRPEQRQPAPNPQQNRNQQQNRQGGQQGGQQRHPQGGQGGGGGGQRGQHGNQPRGGTRPPQQNQPNQQRPNQQGRQQPQQGGGRAPQQQQPPRPAPVVPQGIKPAPAAIRGPMVVEMPPAMATIVTDAVPETIPLPPIAPEAADALAQPLVPVAPDSPPVPAPTAAEAEAESAALAPFAEDIEIDEEPQQPMKRREPTGREMLINVVEGEEIRIAVVRKGLLEELYMERSSSESHVGNIYKGRVTNVEPSIQAAFIDFGIGKNGFLHISDLHPQYFPQSWQPRQPRRHGGGRQDQSARQQDTAAAAQETAEERATVIAGAEGEQQPVTQTVAGTEHQHGGIYGNGDLGPDDMDFDVEDGHMQPMERVGRKTPRRERPPIQQCLRRGQEVIVQVTKEGIGTKGPTLTTYISCPGRYLVMMPGMSHLGVSRKIEDEEQRRSLRKVLEELAPPKNLGFIIRTAGVDVAKRGLQGDLAYLVRMWKVIANRIRNNKAPVELYQESDLVIRTIRDVFNNEIDRIIVDNEQVASRIRDFLSIVNPRSAGAVELYTGTMPIFQRYSVEREIEKIHSRRVEIPNGGSLVIDSAEALVAIDVNSGRYREQRDAEMTAFNMNKEAVKEVVRQLRLRDLGGVIVIDFIDMREERHKREIERLLKEELKDDRAKTKVLRMSQFCMIEMTRQRVRPSLKRSIYMDCPHCHGSALIKTPESVTLDVMRRLAAGSTRNDVARIEVRVYPTVATYLLNRKRKALVDLEDKAAKRINITGDNTLAGDAILLEAYDARGSLLNVVL